MDMLRIRGTLLPCAHDPLALGFGFVQGGQEQGRQNGDDRDDHQKLDQSKRQLGWALFRKGSVLKPVIHTPERQFR